METKIIVGLFIGVLCGIVPFCFGFLMKNRIWGIIGAVLCSGSGALFNLIDRPPFTALFVGLIFVVIIIADNKRKAKSQHKIDSFEDNDDFEDYNYKSN